MHTWLHVGPPGSRVAALVVGPEGDVYFELDATVWRIGPRGAATEVVGIPDAHADGALIAVEHDGLLCRFSDGVVGTVTPDGARHDLRRLEPAPVAIAACAEYLAWSSGDAIWRWWRDGREAPQRVGEHRRANPHPVRLAIRPSRRESARLAPDLVVAVLNRVGLVDAEELEWLAGADKGAISHVACRPGGIAYATEKMLGYYDLDTDTNRHVATLTSPPTALAMWSDMVALYGAKGRVMNITVRSKGGGALEETGAHHLAVAHGKVYAAWSDARVAGVWSRPSVGADEPRKSALDLFRFGADGGGTHVAIAHDGQWRTAREGGRLPAAVTRMLWTWPWEGPYPSDAHPWPQRGVTVVARGPLSWAAAPGERGGVADAIRGLAGLLAPHVPAAASMC